MLKLNYFLADIFILSAEKQPIKLSWRKIEWLRNLHNHIADLKVIDSFSEDEMPSILRDEYIGEYGKLPFD